MSPPARVALESRSRCLAIDAVEVLDLRLDDPRQELGREVEAPRVVGGEILAEARSNRPELGNGTDIYRKFVEPTNPSFNARKEELAGSILA